MARTMKTFVMKRVDEVGIAEKPVPVPRVEMGNKTIRTDL